MLANTRQMAGKVAMLNRFMPAIQKDMLREITPAGHADL